MRLKRNLFKNVFTPRRKQPGIKEPQQINYNKISPPETLALDDAKIKQIASIFSAEIIRQIKGDELIPIAMLRREKISEIGKL